MKTEQLTWTPKAGWQSQPTKEFKQKSQLVFLFGARSVLDRNDLYREIKAFYPAASIAGCSTSGEIQDTDILDDSLVVTAVHFDHTRVKLNSVQIDEPTQSLNAGEELGRGLEPSGLSHVVVLADGLRTNGTDLVKGLKNSLPQEVRVTGGLAGDGELFEKTLVCCEGPAQEGQIAVIGFYGSQLQVKCGSVAGWVPFGPERLITKSRNNILYELDGQPAIDLYRTILQEETTVDLSSARFHFPLEIRSDEMSRGIVRTIVAVDEKDNSLVFAGDVPEGYQARLMKVNFNRLMEGASQAARDSMPQKTSPDLALMVSCVGRKIVLKQRTFQELEAVRDILGNETTMAGFYSYGEIAPFAKGQDCLLHNETMTITTFSEA